MLINIFVNHFHNLPGMLANCADTSDRLDSTLFVYLGNVQSKNNSFLVPTQHLCKPITCTQQNQADSQPHIQRVYG
jgi:hypothetical protein